MNSLTHLDLIFYVTLTKQLISPLQSSLGMDMRVEFIGVSMVGYSISKDVCLIRSVV